MRQIVLDTETTGLDPKQGHRIIEVAAVEMVNRRLSGNRFHRYLNAGRDSDPGALQVHGLTTEFLQDKPKFTEVATELLEFLSGAELVIHNASFDINFLNHELALLDLSPVTLCCDGVVDTLKMAKDLHPGKKNNLDALCDRYQIDNSRRTLHGALLDAELLAEVYLSMTRGQESLVMLEPEPTAAMSVEFSLDGIRPALLVLAANVEELALHAAQLVEIDKTSRGACVWNSLTPAAVVPELLSA